VFIPHVKEDFLEENCNYFRHLYISQFFSKENLYVVFLHRVANFTINMIINIFLQVLFSNSNKLLCLDMKIIDFRQQFLFYKN